MNKGISFYFGYKTDINERTKSIKNSGLNCVMTNADNKFKKDNGTIKQQMKLFKKYNLKVTSLHMQYNSWELPYFWKKGIKGFKLFKRLVKDIKLANKYGFLCVVVHLKGELSDIGLKRFNKVLKICDKFNVDIAIENVDSPLFKYVLDNINHKHLKFCYDTGHNHCIDNDEPYLEKYLDKLICLHLHDNLGNGDSHALNKYGDFNWDNFARILAKADQEISLDYEILYKFENSPEEVLNIVYNQACELENLILKYKNKKA